MSEFIVKLPHEWKNVAEDLPELGKRVEVLCTIITDASLVGTEPKCLWRQECDTLEVDVKLWRLKEEPEQQEVKNEST